MKTEKKKRGKWKTAVVGMAAIGVCAVVSASREAVGKMCDGVLHLAGRIKARMRGKLADHAASGS